MYVKRLNTFQQLELVGRNNSEKKQYFIFSDFISSGWGEKYIQ